MAHRGVGDYALATSQFFDLTGASFAALRLPAVIAALALLLGPLSAWTLRRRGHGFEATVSVAFTGAIFLIAAHIALVRFQPMLSSRSIANTINRLAGPGDELLLYGDQAYGSSVTFYTHRNALLVDGRSSSMVWGSYYPDAPHIFLEDSDLLSTWGTGPRKFLFVPGDFHDHVEQAPQRKALQTAGSRRQDPVHRSTPVALAFSPLAFSRRRGHFVWDNGRQ